MLNNPINTDIKNYFVLCVFSINSHGCEIYLLHQLLYNQLKSNIQHHLI